MADAGLIALILALIASVYSAIAFIIGAVKGYTRLRASARISLFASCGFISLAAYFLYYALLTHDFQLEYVALHTIRGMPLIYNISAFWAGNEGSLLFMSWFLSLFAALILIRKREGDKKFSAYASAVIMGTIVFFVLLMILTANPFDKSDPSRFYYGPNPILENPGMALHPPLLLAGYIAFTVPFALAVAAIITKTEDRDWLPKVRTWALLAWLLLGLGNIIGAWWAYVELGWGGYWAWDPIENAGLMPWLVGTALLHSMSMQRRTGMLKLWTAILVILAFNLCIFGMFLTRSDFLSSVHNYINTGMEPLFLTFLAITLIGPLILILCRRSYFKGEQKEVPLISKENSFILTNILFLAAAFAVLLGTLFPWLSENIAGSITTLDTSFFNKAVGPIFILIILLAGICILLSWRRTSFLEFVRKVVYPLFISLLLCLSLYLVGIREWYALTLFPLCSFIVFAHLFSVYRDVRTRSRITKKNPLKVLAHSFRSNRPLFGGMIVHLGIVLIAMGIIGSSFYQHEVQTSIPLGGSKTIQNYTINYEDITIEEASTKIIFTIKMSVYDGDSLVGVLEPEHTIDYKLREASEVAILSLPHWWLPQEDLYLAPGLNFDLISSDWTMDDPLPVKVLINPLVGLIWIGGGVLTLGGLFAFWPIGIRLGFRSKGKHKGEDDGIEIESAPLADSTSHIPSESDIAVDSDREETD